MIDEIVSRLEHIPPELLKKLLSGVLWEGIPESGTIAFTFDDGPDPQITPRVLDLLDEYNARATFFLIGEKAKKHPSLVADIVKRGHLTGCHSMTHRSLFLAGSDVVAAEIDDAQAAISDAAGTAPRHFRPPHGLFDLTGLKLVRDRGLLMTLWTVLAGDYSSDSEDVIIRRVAPFIRAGSILVFHDTAEGGGKMLSGLLSNLLSLTRDSGVRADTLDSLTFSSSIEVSDDDS